MSQWRVQLFHSGAGRAEDPTVVSDFRKVYGWYESL